MIYRKEILKMAKGAMNKLVSPQDSINRLLEGIAPQNLDEMGKKVWILKLVAENMNVAYDISLKEIQGTKNEN